MRIVFAFLFASGLSLSGFAGAALAQPSGADDAPAETLAPGGKSIVARSFAEEHQARLDGLFSDLKRERNEKAAERISGRIWQEWLQSGSATVDLMMGWSNDAIAAKKFSVALDFLDQVVVLEPDYPEAWNKRATVHFMMDNYRKSMADIDRTLRLEPRHFGALTGMATILKATGQKQLALDAYQRVLDIYPMMRSAQGEVATLADELAGQGI